MDYFLALSMSALVALSRHLLVSAVIFAVLRWRSVATIYALPSSLIFAGNIFYFASGSLLAFLKIAFWSMFFEQILYHLIPLGLVAWLLWSHQRAAGLLLLLLELGGIVLTAAAFLRMSKNVHMPIAPFLATIVVTAPVRIAIILACARIASGRPQDAERKAVSGVFE